MKKEIIEDVRREAKSHIANARLRDALQCIKLFVERYLVKNSQIEKHFLNLFNEYSSIRGKAIDGVLSAEEIRLQENRLTDRFLLLLEDFDNIQLTDLEDKANIAFSNQIVPSEFYITKEVLILIEQLMQADDKIYDLKITIENKRIEITKTNNKEKLENEIINLQYEISEEKKVYYELKAEYDKLKKKVGIENVQFSENEDYKLGNDLKETFRDILEDYKGVVVSRVEKLKDEMIEAFQRDKNKIQSDNSMLFSYLDDINKRIARLEELFQRNR